MEARVRFVVLVSGTGSNLQAVLDACGEDALHGQVVAVVSNRADAPGLQRAADAGVTAIHMGVVPGEDRAGYDTRLAEAVAAFRPDVVVLAGWMRVLTMAFISRFPGRVVNLHPARPGELPGTHAIERAYEEFVAGRRDSTGVMVHLVTDEGVDDGTVLGSTDVPIGPDDTLEMLAGRVHAAEHELLVHTLAQLCETLSSTRESSSREEEVLR
jgi:formyltetrahydrofolate-dependent phosphoribosylglycinamide formyltransferase